MKCLRNPDLIASIIFFILGLITLFVLIPNGVAVPASVNSYILSPDFWPTLIAVAWMVSALFLLIESYFVKTIHDSQITYNDSDEDAVEEETDQYQIPEPTATLRVVLLIGGFFLIYFCLPALGLVVSSILIMAAMMIYFGERHYILVISLSIVLPVLLFAFFRYAASVPIPVGIFQF